MKISYFLFLITFLSFNSGQAQVYYAGKAPKKPSIKTSKKQDVLSNNVLSLQLQKSTSPYLHFETATIADKVSKNQIKLNTKDFFKLVVGKDTLFISNFKILDSKILKDSNDFLAHKYTLVSEDEAIRFELKISLGKDQNYVSQEFKFTSGSEKIKSIIPFSIPKNKDTRVEGIVDGSPLVSGNLFFVIENPMFKVSSTQSNFSVGISAPSEINESKSFSVTSTTGVAPENQLRRGFLYYLEKKRARPYKPFLHYNSWYDLSYNADTLREKDCLDRVITWTDELTKKRNIKLDGFLWDSGWDDFDHLWKFNKYLPNGFSKMNDYASQYGTGMGVWLSPWGGYDDAVVLRMKGVAKNNPTLEQNKNGFTVAQPNYYKYFRNTALNFVDKENVKIFKIDGVGAGLKASGPGQEFTKDIDAFLTIISDLRSRKPDTYFSLTVGTWPSPFWLMYGDNIWRGGSDMSLMGKGNLRQRWMNYRDGDTYNLIVKRAPLYPLNALMNHGITVATQGLPKRLENDPANLYDDFWTFFASGTSLQEMYINPHLLTKENWDELAKVIQWSRSKQNILVDSHWVGGSPEKEEVYGFASWNPDGGVLFLRNPSDVAQTFTYSLDEALEIPKGFSGNYMMKNVRKNSETEKINSDAKATITLQPFEIKLMDVIKI